MKTKNVIILSAAIVLAALIGAAAYCFTNRYVVNEYALVDTWKKEAYPIKVILYTPRYDSNGDFIKPFGNK